MKSIMEEASSIVKAIEAAWIRAEKPREFSVKIFEEPEKNFFGMVTKSAKIALIFKHIEKKSTYKEQSSAPKHKSAPHTQESIFSSSKEYSRNEHAAHEPREYREPRVRETREREQREPREHREQREPREHRESREPREQREPREYREQREPREPMVREVTRKPAAPARERELDAADQDTKDKVFWTEEMIDTTRTWIETLLKNLDCNASFTLEPKRYYLTIAFDKPIRDTKSLEQQLFRSCAYLIMQMLRTKLKKQFRGLKVVLHSPSE